MRNYLKYQSPGVQFAVFLGLSAAMFLIYMTIAQGAFGEVTRALTSSGEVSDDTLRQFRWSQTLSAVMTFIIPALVYAYLSDPKPFQYLGLKRDVSPFLIFLVIVLLVAAQPFALYMGQLNQQVNFGPMQNELKRMEEITENAMNHFVQMKSPSDLFINFLIIGILPAIGEEIFFRGSLQNILERWTRVPWVAIVLSSLFFAFLHLTAFKFLGILILGAVLGTLFYVTRNLWYNVLFHFLNNSVALLATYYATRNDMMKKLASDDYKISAVAALISLAVTIGIFLLIRKRRPVQPLTSPAPGSAQFDID
jgi:membrane protease YdiL (CAAX protease family)